LLLLFFHGSEASALRFVFAQLCGFCRGITSSWLLLSSWQALFS
jgi:hypothetical protein